MKYELCYDSLIYEARNIILPNFCTYCSNFDLDLNTCIKRPKYNIEKMCSENYDIFWKTQILQSTKAESYNKFKDNISLEKNLIIRYNLKHKIALTRFRMSNHTLLIEKGRHAKIDKTERKCYFCPDTIENEQHFLISCPLYSRLRINLITPCIENCSKYINLNEEQKFIFLMSNENEIIIKALAKFVSDAFMLRERIVLYFFS